MNLTTRTLTIDDSVCPLAASEMESLAENRGLRVVSCGTPDELLSEQGRSSFYKLSLAGDTITIDNFIKDVAIGIEE